MLKLAALIALIFAAAPSQVRAQAVSNGTSTANSQPIVVKQTRKICRTEIPTGSMLAKRVCRTETEIVQQQADGRALIEELARDQLNKQVQQEVRSR